MWCNIKEIDKLTAFDKGYNVIKNTPIPILTYKGIEFNEEDVSDIASNELEELFEIEMKGVDELIDSGVLTPAVKGMDWKKDTFAITNDYLCNPNNHENILALMDDMIYAMLNENLYEEMSDKANEAYDEEVVDGYCYEAQYALVRFALESEDNLKKLILSEWGERELSEIKENASESYSNLKESIETFLDDNCLPEDYKRLCDNVLFVDKRPYVPYILYVQNGKWKDCYSDEHLIKSFKSLSEQYKDLAVVAFSVNGTEFKGRLNEEDFKEMTKTLGIPNPDSLLEIIKRAESKQKKETFERE